MAKTPAKKSSIKKTAKKISPQTASEKISPVIKQEIANYIEEFQISTGIEMPDRAQQFLLNHEFIKLNGKDITKLFKKVPSSTKIKLHFDATPGKNFPRLMVLADHIGAYFSEDIDDKCFVPLVLLKGEFACIGIVTDDDDHNIYLFGQEIQSFKYKDGLSPLNVTLDQLFSGKQATKRVSKKASAEKPSSKGKVTLATKVLLKQTEIDSYYEEFENVTGNKFPVRGLSYFNKKEFEKLNGKNVSNYLDGYSYGSKATLEIDLEKMKMLTEFSNDGYFSNEKYLPLATLKGQSAYIGIKATDKDEKVYFFDFQDGFFPQDYTLDQLISKFK